MSKLGPLVLVKWKDAKSEPAGWKDVDEIANGRPAIVESVGWVVKKTKTKLVIISSYIKEHHQCDGDLLIPLSWIISVTELVPKA